VTYPPFVEPSANQNEGSILFLTPTSWACQNQHRGEIVFLSNVDIDARHSQTNTRDRSPRTNEVKTQIAQNHKKTKHLWETEN
jgi:hypothetical protein